MGRKGRKGVRVRYAVKPTRNELVWERDELCDVCRVLFAENNHITNSCHVGSERHHGLFKCMKDVPTLDLKYNLFLVCKSCHEKRVWGDRIKYLLWELQCRRYGREVMMNWWESVPFSDKPRFWLLGGGDE